MVRTQDQTVWFPKDSLLSVVVGIPVWGIAGLGWGFMMALTLSGSLLIWLLLGLFWGAFVWFFVSIFQLIMGREVSTKLPMPDNAMLSELLDKAVKPLRYIMEQQSSTSFVCTPKRGLARLFECNKLHVQLLDDGLHLIGPAIVVNKVRKKLLVGCPPRHYSGNMNER
jgi:hypothetical protein